MLKLCNPPLLFVEQHLDDHHQNKASLNAAWVKSHVGRILSVPQGWESTSAKG
jgi:hypothetical protein